MKPQSVAAAALILLACLLAALSDAWAHDSRPVVVGISEQGEAVYAVTVTTPPSVPLFNIPRVGMPPGCARWARAAPPSRRWCRGRSTAARAA